MQRHARAGRTYGVRLEIDGVPASWAAPKGPTLDPKVRRAAFHVEDHPLEYFDFEGVVPTGRYGGGDVIVWDARTWEPHEAPDPGRAVADGGLHLDLYGDKLRGRFILVRTRTNSSGKEEWLLPHKHDEYALKAPVVDAPSKQELAGLDTLEASGVWSIFGRDVRVTNLDRILFPGRAGDGLSPDGICWDTRRGSRRWRCRVGRTPRPTRTTPAATSWSTSPPR